MVFGDPQRKESQDDVSIGREFAWTFADTGDL
jgi:hypothetical protein